jgi:hypothetical protein
MSAASEQRGSAVAIFITSATAGWLFLLFLPFLVSLAAKVATPKVLCFMSSMLALLLSIKPYSAVLPWALGMAIAVISLRERIRSADNH